LKSTSFVLVHGAWHSGACWAEVAALLAERGHSVLVPDLPGHGNNPLPLNKVSLKVYVDSLLEVLARTDDKVILVGHSMAGIVISEAAAQQPEKIAHLVYLCAYLPRDEESLFDLITLNRSHEPFTAIELAMRMSDDKRSCTIDEDDIIPLFYPLVPPAAAARAKAAFGSQATLPLATKVKLAGTAFDTVPRTYICCTQDRVIPLHHQRRMLNRQSCDTLLQIEADHSPFYSAPGQLAALLAAIGD
jgi:pimeloyl-ACP methyl ester carboxylesterase